MSNYRHPERVEVGDFHPDAHPQVSAAELELHRVYVISGARISATWNYEGTRHLLHPVTLDVVLLHHFHGPRLNLDVFLQARPDGTFTDGVGTHIVIRRYTGEDA